MKRPSPASQHRGGRGVLQQVVDRGDAAVRLPVGAAEPSSRLVRSRIDREPGAGDRAGAEGTEVGHVEGGAQAGGVALQLLDDRQQVVRDGDGCAAGCACGAPGSCPVLPGEPDEVSLKRGSRPARPARPAAAASGTSSCRCRCGCGPCGGAGDGVAAAFDEQAIDIEEQVLARTVELRPAGVLDVDGVQAVAQGAGILAGHDAPGPRASRDGRAGSPATGRGTAPWRRRSSREGRS